MKSKTVGTELNSSMKLENQVCSLEHAKRLKELGVKQESYFKWRSDGAEVIPAHELREDYWAEFPSALTVAELGELLPEKFTGEHAGWHLDIHKETMTDGLCYWLVDYTEQQPCGSVMSYFDEIFADTTEADARAKMLIYLIENDLITI